MYAMVMSTRAMRDYIQEMYAMEISPAEISRITDSVLPAVQEWRNRPLEAVTPSYSWMMKLMYLVIKNISKKWIMPMHNWGLAFHNFILNLVKESLRKIEASERL